MNSKVNGSAVALICAVVSVLCLAGTASATSTVTSDGSTMTFVGGAGDASSIFTSSNGTSVTFDDSAGVTAGAGCNQVQSTKVTCPTVTLPISVQVDAGDNVDYVGSYAQFDASINGGDGNDTIYVGDYATRTNFVLGGSGNDTITTAGSTDWVDGGDGDDDLTSGAGDDVFYGGAGNDILRSDTTDINDDDIYYDGDGNDTIHRGGGQDFVENGAGADTYVVDVAGGTDTISYSQRSTALTITVDGVANDGDSTDGVGTRDNIPTGVIVAGGVGNDTVTGDANANKFIGYAGNDTLNGGGGNDVLDARDGTNTLNGGDGDDSMVGGANVDTFNGGNGNDSMLGYGSGDIFNGNAGVDRVNYSDKSATVTVTINGTANDGVSGEADNVKTDIENITGGSAGDSITAQSSGSVANVLDGAGGNDTLNGNDGADTLIGGTGIDTVNGGSGNDSVLIRDGQSDITNCSTGTDTVTADLLPNDSTVTGCETVNRAAF